MDFIYSIFYLFIYYLFHSLFIPVIPEESHFSLLLFEQLTPLKNYESALHIVFHLILKEAIKYPYLKYSPVMQETQVWSLGWEDPLEKEVATHPSVLAWRIPWTEDLGRLQSMGLQRVGHDWATNTHT